MKDALSSSHLSRRDFCKYVGAAAFGLLPNLPTIPTSLTDRLLQANPDDQPARKQTDVNPTWEVPLNKEGPISYAEAMAIAKRIDSCIASLPAYRLPIDLFTDGTCDESKTRLFLDNLYKDVAPAMEANDFADHVLPPSSITFDECLNSVHQKTSDPKNCRNIRLNLDRLKEAPERTRLSRFVKQSIHTFSHVIQSIICGDKTAEAMLEPTAQIITAESLAYLVYRGRIWAFEPFLVNLREMALLTAWRQAAVENCEELFYADLEGIQDAYSDVLLSDLKDKYSYKDLLDNDKLHVDHYGSIPFNIIVRSTQEELVQIEGLSLVGTYWENLNGEEMKEGRIPKIVILNDTKSLVPNINGLAGYIAIKNYPY